LLKSGKRELSSSGEAQVGEIKVGRGELILRVLSEEGGEANLRKGGIVEEGVRKGAKALRSRHRSANLYYKSSWEVNRRRWGPPSNPALDSTYRGIFGEGGRKPGHDEALCSVLDALEDNQICRQGKKRSMDRVI